MAFDLTVDHRDPKTGRIVKHTPYTAYISDAGTVYLRDGVFYTPGGEVAQDHWVESIAGRDALKLKKAPEAVPSKK